MTRSFAEDKRIVDTKLKGSYSIFCECTVVSPFVLQYRQRIHLHKERPRSRVTTFLPAFARCCKKKKEVVSTHATLLDLDGSKVRQRASSL